MSCTGCKLLTGLVFVLHTLGVCTPIVVVAGRGLDFR